MIEPTTPVDDDPEYDEDIIDDQVPLTPDWPAPTDPSTIPPDQGDSEVVR